MTKYARLMDHSEKQDGSDVRTVDVVDLADYDPRPTGGRWGTTEDEFLQAIFATPLVAQWKASGHWFVAVPHGVQAGAVLTGSDHTDPMAYANPDKTYGDGTPIPPPKEGGAAAALTDG